jgi:hypothetical protein
MENAGVAPPGDSGGSNLNDVFGISDEVTDAEANEEAEF